MGRAKRSKVNLKDKLLIFTNGKTEHVYFNILRKDSIYDVKVIQCNSAPADLVQEAIENKSKSDKIWCVFDVDYTYEEKQLKPALALAKDNGIKIAYSNISFEVWLLSHFVIFNKESKAPEVVKELEKHLEQQYKKADENQLKSKFIPHTEKAIENAKTKYQRTLKEYNKRPNYGIEPIWEWNPSTTVFKLIEELRLESLLKK